MDDFRKYWKEIDSFDERARPILNALVAYIHHEGKDRGDSLNLVTLAYILQSCIEVIEKYLDGEYVDDKAPVQIPEKLPIDWARFKDLIPMGDN